jgi:hypothetical protein
VSHPRNVLIGQDSVDARQGFGIARVNALDAGVRVRAGKYLAVEHPRKVNVVGKSRAAGDEFESVYLLNVLSDD